MKQILAGALALSLIAGSSAMAQPNDQGRQDHQASSDQRSNGRGYQQDQVQTDHGRNNFDGGQRHHRRQVCTFRHHHRVCYWR